ncbi:MAG: hypothetical protein DCF19_19885 [Pseudanabaena frigida]|uniref:HAMP domain-containing protein n=1 Tax=Pseudanabaena frigida TaxID=945775 RepID=A0A2W4W0R2_9CYAN|nr:MAG: hypothetical protein DCF19_19885 [Pseudanabaena frigida]
MSSIRQIFPIVLSIQITVAVGITGWISFNSGERAVQKLTRQLCDNLNSRIEQQITNYFEESVQVSQAVRTSLSNGSVNTSDINQVQKDLFNKSREFDIENIIFYGNEKGAMVGIDRQQDTSKFLLRIRDESTAPNRPTYELSDNGERGKLVMNELYDHRTRPWYTAAKKSGEPIWSSIFVSTVDGELTTTKATPIYSPDGSFQGVAGINISLKQIKQFMKEIRPNDKWNVFLVEANGNLVSTTSDEAVFKKDGNQITRFEVSQSKDPRLQKVGLAVQEKFGGFQNLQSSELIEFESNGEKYIVSTHRLSKDLKLDWSVGIIVPKSIFMQEIDANNNVTVVIIAIMLGINILIGLAIATWLLRPIKNLMNAAKQIEEESFDPEELTSVAQRKDELGQMARVFQEMGSTIAERQQGMKSQLRKLREEKDEAKKAAIASQMGQTNSLQSILSRSRAARNN